MTPKELLIRNKAWRKSLIAKGSDKLHKLAQGQHPEVLLIGCSDSRVSPSVLFGAKLGELFIHRNIANQVKINDPNFLSILEFSINVLKVKYIIVLGHYGCGGVKAAMSEPTKSEVSNWVSPIREIGHCQEVKMQKTDKKRWDKLVELNAHKQMSHIKNTNIYKKAKEKGTEPELLAWVVNIASGEIIELPEILLMQP